MNLTRLRSAATVFLLTGTALLSWAPHLQAQGGPLGGMGRGPKFGSQMVKIFGEHQAFSGNVEIRATPTDRPEPITMPGKLAFHEGKSRLDMDITLVKGSMMPAGMGAQIKAMGMSDMSMIGRPDKKENYLVYPNLQSYALLRETGETPPVEKLTVEITELGKETIEGHACIKNKVIVTGPDGKKTESTVWNATDLKKFPIRISTAEESATVQMTFSQVKFEKPDAKLFEPPTGSTKYDDVQSMMREAMMKKLGAPGGLEAK